MRGRSYKSKLPGTCRPLMRLGIQALLLEVTFLRSQNLNLKSEKEKLRSDIVEANQRSAIMAQEIDDQGRDSIEMHLVSVLS